MTPLSRRLLVRILFQRWLAEKSDKFMEKAHRMLDKILNEEELDSQGGKMIIWPTTEGDKRRVLRDLRSKIKDRIAASRPVISKPITKIRARAVGSKLYTRSR